MLDRLETEHAELEKLENIRKDFVINVSHELRTPLASIQGYTETLLDGAIHDPANNLKFLNIIRQNAERLARLTADLLTLSRVELSQQEFKFASYYVNRLLTDNLDGMRPIAERRGIQLVLQPVEPESAEVFCDAEAVHQILTNLLDNAIKYTPDGGTVTVGARQLGASSDPAGRVEFFVRDTGSGHSRRRPAPPLRTLLPGRQSPLPGARRDRPGPGDREASGALPERRGSRGKPSG